MTQEALKLALEELAVRFSEGWHEGIKIDASDIMLLNEAAQALAQPEPCDMGAICIGCSPRNADGSCPSSQPKQEPVAWTLLLTGEHNGLIGKAGEKFIGAPDYYQRVNVYTALPRRTWVGLTDVEIDYLLGSTAGENEETHISFARAIEAKLKDKNS
jgi:hypothetical protein